MASQPPVDDDIVVTASLSNRREIIAFVPQIGELTSRGGLSYDMAVSEEVTHANELTRHPIEDPTRSFIYDHNREEPTSIQLSLVVSSEPLIAGDENNFALRGVDRITQFQDALLAMRAGQSVGTSSYLDVYTGLRVYYNMAIEQLTFRRMPETPNVLEVDLSLVEMRFANPPRAESEIYLMDANAGPRNAANAELVEEPDRPIVEAMRDRQAPRFAALTRQTESMLRASVRGLPVATTSFLGIDLTDVVTTLDEVSLLMLDTLPAQKYTLNILGDDFDFAFSYNQLGDAWSLTAGLSLDACPRVAGRRMVPGYNLLAGVTDARILVALDRPGIGVNKLTGYARFTMPLRDGVPATYLAYGTRQAFAGLFSVPAQVRC